MSSQPCSTGVPAVSPPSPGEIPCLITAEKRMPMPQCHSPQQCMKGGAPDHGNSGSSRIPKPIPRRGADAGHRRHGRTIVPCFPPAAPPIPQKPAITGVPGSIHNPAFCSGFYSKDTPVTEDMHAEIPPHSAGLPAVSVGPGTMRPAPRSSRQG